MVAVAGLLLLSAGCGFQPMHATGGATPQALSSIDIAPIPDRLGQVLHNNLLDRLAPRGVVAFPRYRLVVSLQVTKEALAIARDESATRYNVALVAEYALVLLETGAKVLEGEARSISAYNVVSSDYATLVAERDAELRSAREISDDLRTRIAVFLARNDHS